MYNFVYHKPTSIADALKLLGSSEDPKIVSGGMTLIPTLKQRLARPSDLIDLKAIPDLSFIRREGANIVIGAMTKHAEVAASDVVKAIPGLAYLAGVIGDAQVRNRGTIGGSVANNDPAADYPGAVVALNATITTNERTIAGDDFFTGLFETALNPNEIVTAVSFPIVEKSAYTKFRNPASRYAIVGAFVAKTAGGVRVAITGAGPCVFRVPEMEKALAGSFTPDAIKDVKVAADNLNSDIHASAEYRAHLCNVMARRAVTACG
jgi:carbon-monoxide dehydrogenase medium subunit